MDKKDIYEHLANIYLDASSSKKKRKHKKDHKFKNLLFANLAITLSLGLFLFVNIHKNKPFTSSEIACPLYSDLIKINFNFGRLQKELYSIRLNSQNLSGYKALGFSLKKYNYKDKISLKIEFSNASNDKSSLYLKDIPHKWKEYRIALSDFKDLSDWTRMSKLSFSVQERGTKKLRDFICIDNIRVLR